MNRLSTTLQADWLDGRRARAWRTILLVATLAIAAAWVAGSRHGIDAAGKPIGTDFLAFWSAARLALGGQATQIYDVARLYAVERAAMPVDPGPSSFLYPPPFLLVCVGFGLLPYFVALALWLGATGAAFMGAVRGWIAPHRGRWATMLAFPAVLSNAGHGQNGFLTAALLAGGLGQLDRRPWLGGALIGCLVVKPQVALAVPVLLVAGRHWRALGGAVASGAALCLAATAAFGWAIWPAFVAGGATGRAILDQGLVEPAKMVSLYAALRLLGTGAAPAYVAQALLAVAAIAATILAARRGTVAGGAATAVAASTLVSPFLLDYDLTILAVPLAWVFGEGLRRGWRSSEKLVLLAAYTLPLYARDLALSVGVPVAPLILAALAATTLSAAIRSSPSRR